MEALHWAVAFRARAVDGVVRKTGIAVDSRARRRQLWGLRVRRGYVRALQEQVGGAGGRRGRLVEVVRRIPPAIDRYFNQSPFRRALWGGIALLGGFYVAQTISLSFGALGVNDVIAAVLCVLFTEYVTRFYYTRPSPPSFYVALLNNFKMGFSYGLFIDAFKLAS